MYLLVGKIKKKLSVLVRDKIIQLFSSISSNLVKTETPERGKECSKHSEVTKVLNGIQFYFSNPHTP